MNSAEEAFRDAQSEIERYFEFLRPHLDPSVALVENPLDDELQKILKAAAMLLLYNVVEASVRNGMLSVYEAINAAHIDYEQASGAMRDAWLEHRLRPLDKSSTRYDTFRQNARQLMDDAVNRTALAFSLNESGSLDFSGNVDARKIRDLAEKHGIPINAKLKESRGFRLLEIKNQRNRLMHGHISFADCGRDLDWVGMCDAKQQVSDYISDWFQCLRSFIHGLNAEPQEQTS